MVVFFTMKILQVCPYTYGLGIGGVAEYVQNISERLAERHQVTVYSTDATGRLPRDAVVNGVRVMRFRRFAPGRAYFMSWDMLLRLKKSEFDVVHGHAYHALPLHFSRLAKCRRFIVSAHFHGVGSSRFRDCLIKLLKPVGERTLKKADRIIAVSDYEKNLLRQFRIDPDRIVTIPCGVDFAEFSNLMRQKRSIKSVLYVGSLEGYKGTERLVEALPWLDDEVILEIVGKGPMRKFLEKRAIELNVLERVKFYYNLPRTELLQKYVDADVLVLLSKYEAYSMVVAEALVAGVPCIVAKTSALKEWIDNRNCFGIQSSANVAKLADLINNVLERNSRVDWREIKIGKIQDWNDVVEKLQSVYAA